MEGLRVELLQVETHLIPLPALTSIYFLIMNRCKKKLQAHFEYIQKF